MTQFEGIAIMAHDQALDRTNFRQDVQGLGQGIDALKTDVKNLAHGAADAARSGVAELRQGAHSAVETAKGALDGAKEMAREKFEGARESASDATESLRGVISRNPVASIGVAAGVGLLIGLVLCRPRS